MSKEYYNNYPEGFLEPFKEKTTFRLVDIKPDRDNPGAYLMPSVTSIPPSSTVIFNENEEVHLALVLSFDTEGNMKPDDRSMMLGQFNGGELILDPRKPKHVAMFNYINHCHWNRTSKYTYPGAKHVVEKVDHETIAAKENEVTDNKMVALMTIATINDAQVDALAKELLAKEPEDSPLSTSVRKSNLGSLADKYPEKIIETCKLLGFHLAQAPGAKSVVPQVEIDPFIKTKIDQLMDDGIITQANKAKSFLIKETGDVLFQWESGNGSPSEKFAIAISGDDDLRDKIESL